MNIVGSIKRNSSTILSIAAMFGVIGTAVSAGWAVKKSEDKRRHTLRYEGYYYDDKKVDVPIVEHEEITAKEYIKLNWKYYIPTVGFIVATCSAIGLSEHINKKRQAALISACVATTNAYRAYREAVIEQYGKEEDSKIVESTMENPSQDDILDLTSDEYEGETLLFYETLSKRYFNATMEHVKDAEYHFNRNLNLRDYALLNEFYEFLGIDKTEEGDVLGWCTWAESTYGYKWVDFCHDKVVMDDGLECYIISYPFEPHADYYEC